mmetsp:Transcript_29910/g.53543  ORF Transcript_29910/g.53543 Transcript_29910/m.53543 type:complete len:285 (-) Transcript_29910:378-1232(-)|eukprot:CAMPEP_0177773542 /NCGR_PEP_ID=MMETSP0491_2-20121128/12936_1 /TAXON_ID=63592 /ORGANISM="Tetraselmis chuii, Strain PLY429" /LENGTH=284 /DNA_ID=CAMNT_0019291675 /DNA_START=196 /DNA_END=1050 /DNA_ORIENTATION=-
MASRRTSIDEKAPHGHCEEADALVMTSHWNHLPPEILYQIMHYCVLGASNLATVDEAGGTVDGVGGGDELTADGGNCRDILVASSVCKPWRELVCFHPGLLKDLRFTVNEARPFGRVRRQVPSQMLRMMSCPPFPLLVQKAAEDGNASANYALAVLLDLQGMGNSAMKYWRKAAKNGYRRAQLRLGEAYYKGTCNMSQDGEEAYFWLSRAVRNLSDRPDTACAVAGKSLLILGFILFDGEGVARDIEEAVRSFKKAVAYGSKDAEKTLGSIYNTGQYGAASRWQ